MRVVDPQLSDGTLSLGVCAGFSESYAPPRRVDVGFINPRTDPERDEDRYYPKKVVSSLLPESSRDEKNAACTECGGVLFHRGGCSTTDENQALFAARSSHPMRLLAFVGLLAACSPGVLLGWGFSIGMVAGCAISCGLWWVNHD